MSVNRGGSFLTGCSLLLQIQFSCLFVRQLILLQQFHEVLRLVLNAFSHCILLINIFREVYKIVFECKGRNCELNRLIFLQHILICVITVYFIVCDRVLVCQVAFARINNLRRLCPSWPADGLSPFSAHATSVDPGISKIYKVVVKVFRLQLLLHFDSLRQLHNVDNRLRFHVHECLSSTALGQVECPIEIIFLFRNHLVYWCLHYSLLFCICEYVEKLRLLVFYNRLFRFYNFLCDRLNYRRSLQSLLTFLLYFLLNHSLSFLQFSFPLLLLRLYFESLLLCRFCKF